MENSFPVVSIVGRPNVGKSSLFNRIIGNRHAVVEKKEGTTRDRIEKIIEIKNKSFLLVDTGGFMPKSNDRIDLLVKKQIEKALERSDMLLLVCDGEIGLSPLDLEVALIIRKSGKKIIPVVNKIDNKTREGNLLDFYELGLGEPRAISCIHDLGIEELFREIKDVIPERPESEAEKHRPLKIAIVGRPNVGKSSFLNGVLEEERVIVHEAPGTTRDAIDTYFKKDGMTYLLIDTAGMRHKRKVKFAVDVHSIMRARSSIQRSRVTFLLIDAAEGVTRDDAKIFDYIEKERRGCVIIVNKWDLVKGIETHRYKQAILRKIPEARKFPVEFISAKTGRNVLNAFNLAKAVNTNLDLFIDKDLLDEFLSSINPENVKIPRNKKRPRFYSMIQVNVFPKEFLIFVDDPRAISEFHTSFIENRLREKFPLKGVPIRLVYRRRPKLKTVDNRP